MNSQRKKALITREIPSTSSPACGERKSWSTAYRSCIGSSGRNRITLVSGPMVSERANTSYPSTEACRCISISPDSS